ncbi:hypothetical protein ACSSS7_000704 [Eimeria intestinalis]
MKETPLSMEGCGREPTRTEGYDQTNIDAISLLRILIKAAATTAAGEATASGAAGDATPSAAGDATALGAAGDATASASGEGGGGTGEAGAASTASASGGLAASGRLTCCC